jgi:hypothetical protein
MMARFEFIRRQMIFSLDAKPDERRVLAFPAFHFRFQYELARTTKIAACRAKTMLERTSVR